MVFKPQNFQCDEERVGAISSDAIGFTLSQNFIKMLCQAELNQKLLT
jgi:hypothetical protein